MDSLCKCGHTLEDHHNPMICDGLVYEGDSLVAYNPDRHFRGEVASRSTSWYCLENRTDFPHAHGEECEFYGFNETGGMLPLNHEGIPLEWIVDSQGNWHMNEPVWKWIQHCRGFELRWRGTRTG